MRIKLNYFKITYNIHKEANNYNKMNNFIKFIQKIKFNNYKMTNSNINIHKEVDHNNNKVIQKIKNKNNL